MTVLHKERIDKEGVIKLYEAPYHLTKGKERERWVLNGIPCFCEEILQFWKLYGTPFSEYDETNLPPQFERDERKRFIQKPLFLAIREGTNPDVAGGIWLDHKISRIVDGEKLTGSDFHIKFKREARKYAYPSFDFFLRNIGNSYDFLFVEWSQRHKLDDPSRFLKNNGFIIEKYNPGGRSGSAVLYLPRQTNIIHKFPLITDKSQ